MVQITERIDGKHHYDRETLKITLDGMDVTSFCRVADPSEAWVDLYLTVPFKSSQGNWDDAQVHSVYVVGITEIGGRRRVVTVRVYGKVEITGELKEDAS